MTSPATTLLKGNLLDVSRGVLCHQVNCRGRMGKGLALAIKEKWPRVHHEYQRKHQTTGWRLGDAQMVQVGEGLWVANLAGQDGYGADGRLYTDYAALSRALGVAAAFAQKHALPLHVPYGIGCGLAGGDWRRVGALLPVGTIVVRL